MRLTVDHIRRAPQFVNTLQQREVDLRGLRISSLDENALLCLYDGFDVINLTSNALTALEYFPQKNVDRGTDTTMRRVVTLIVHRNQIQKVSVPSCVLALPNVEHFLADDNNLKTLTDILFLRFWKQLQIVSLELNPVWTQNMEGYEESKLRALLVFLCPKLKLINYQRVTQKDRDAAASFKEEFKLLVSASGSASAGDTSQRKTRKRGRENRAGATGGAEGALAGATDGQTALATAGAPSAEDGGADRADDLRVRLERLEQQMENPDVTPQELAALEEEMHQVIGAISRSQKKKSKSS
ncbi:U2 small nuclear ribonucleoprotein A' [Strigomonas culicis]|uniref:U2 small nuclear ribonucleoprotein A n=1 Tax=Strigomonas culicis TaxID=28005 RepID=S9VDW1_9TRYP|nr:U2 small nuclear ribonucleoprotein A' [Strigomonas culicis]EPY31735.1 U2 small nuclear ribonucleoprotein A' [Strigomonas culicis]|eukprot:EPY25221.1 U2 small nuclear ribonucleoprotein A' [Strigomonas culicis]